MAMGSKPFEDAALAVSWQLDKRSSANGGVCSKHWRTEFMKQVLPRFRKPVPCVRKGIYLRHIDDREKGASKVIHWRRNIDGQVLAFHVLTYEASLLHPLHRDSL